MESFRQEGRWSLLAVVCLAVTVRCAVTAMFPSLQQQLDQQVEFSTPMTSYKSLREGLFLLRHGLPVYSGGVVHQPPLLLSVFSRVPNCCHRYLYAVADGVVACQLMLVSRALFSRTPGQRRVPTWVVGLLFALNPLALLSCVSQSTVSLTNVALSSCVYCAVVLRNTWLSGVALAFASYLNVYNAVLAIPLFNAFNGARREVCLFTSVFALCLALLLLLSGSQGNGGAFDGSFLQATYGAMIRFESVAPNLGLWWYFFIEMFQEFIPFFKGVFNVFHVGVTPAIAWRFRGQPLYSFVISLLWLTLTKPYPTLGDTALCFAYLPLFAPLFGYLKYPLFSTLLFLHGVMLSPIFYHLWIDLGSGNSNFFYAVSLVYALALGSIIADFVWAMLRMEYDGGSPNYKRRLTQI
ncbi:GPI-anchor transamidase subunit GAB1 KNAG_0F03930 [Huiozyma naganishii CBS 8797]|uniref:GPI transamidase subunit PIG-U n=1 Tax=Huiozyma naganishii (strain ATCC MYA-139 / BCRC 22969 / CBS 8797 / KCTC 17520 / NBRC 10181 / NCYC 3082 / Yp74L-3) TaxID=1071383 RepID=J7S0M3_HUIN7|nr:hypothetical protein KNAG_0F03930 [Kazachstania naganishii CBS 8797]CCK71057.1 hypothetical protein KNAG_0F03930 [Kazachstania naganishii CBS 8797]